ncbi:YitT family protein [Cohnella cholangitidis]|uniref:YitT family protein n=1 Tax=Cohnella cholangitidis TaxID=2598458 RepID=A0A7G5C3T4_9BACL|nr:YitT family protein [Cohnella cholangitidis]QMV43868.1 YitT family protein [Cohnella cholangitidis]
MKRIAIIGPVFLMIISAAAVGCGFQLLLIPERLLSSGLSGVAMIIGYLSGWNIGWLYFALNVPILLWGYLILGKRFIALSMITVLSTVFFLQVIPEVKLTDDRLLASVFGGVLVGLGSTAALRFGGSSGGFDIIASIISRYRNIPIGILTVLLNTIVVAALGYLQDDWNAALYSMLSIYLTGRIIDAVHTPHHKVTAFIVTNRTQELASRLLKLPRGVTIIKTRGAFTSEERDMLMTVATRYELADLRKMIKEIDSKAFVNVVQTIDVIGDFRKK